MKRLFLPVVLCCSSVLVTNLAAQDRRPTGQEFQPPNAARPGSAETDIAFQRRDFKLVRQAAELLVRQAAEDALTLDDRRSAARIRTAAASALWQADRDYARDLFRKTFDSAVAYYHLAEDSDRVQVTHQLSLARPDLRLEIIRLASSCDAALGREFMEKYVEEKKRELEEKRGLPTGGFDSAFGNVDVTAGDYLRIAASLIDVDRNGAFAMAQRAFVSGIPQASGYFFTQLAGRDRAAADQMYRMALERLSQDTAPVPGQLLLLAAYPFGDSQVWVAGGDGVSSYRFQVPKDFTINSELIHAFSNLALTVLSRTAESDLSQLPDRTTRLGSALFAARLLEPRIAQYEPQMLSSWHATTMNLLASARDKSHDVDEALDQVRDVQETDSKSNPRERIKKLLDRAERTQNSAARDDLYREAAFEANRLNDDKWALDIADEIEDLDYRHAVRVALHFDMAVRAIKEKRLDEAYGLALKVDVLDEQAYLFSEVARTLVKNNDRVLEILEEAARRAEAAPKSPARVRALLGISYLYAGLDLARSFDIATEAVRTVNKIPVFDSDQSRMVRTLETRTGERSSVEVRNVEGFDLAKTVALLARLDFNRTLDLVQSLEKKPLRLATIVSIGASVMEQKQTAKAR